MGFKKESEQRDSNPRHSAWEADTLPTELCSHNWDTIIINKIIFINKKYCYSPLSNSLIRFAESSCLNFAKIGANDFFNLNLASS